MKQIPLGSTGLTATRTGFGALPIQRVEMKEAVRILRRAYDAGITFFDTARAYSDSEEKLGAALSDVRCDIVIATKTTAKNAADFERDLHTSLKMLRTDHIDIYQFHTPAFVPKPGGADGLYEAALKAKQQGKISCISITQHSIDNAFEAVHSGLYTTLQYPFNHLASARDVELLELCATKNMPFIAMKALSGGLVTDASIPFSYIRQFEHAIPIWGIQRMEELEQIIGFENTEPALDNAMLQKIKLDREQLSGAFCRGCGYCLPCPIGIPIQNANRMTQLLTRYPSAQWLTPEWRENMDKIENCTYCGACAKRCPYSMKPYETLPQHLEFFRKFATEHP